MTIIYIRHGKDKKSSHAHDEKLTKSSKVEIEEFTEKLVEQYGKPDIIYYSPFYRTYKTAKYMKQKLNELEIEMKVEPYLGRYFTKKQRKNPEVRKSTYKHGAIIKEKWEQFHDRIELQMNTVLESNYKVVWNITHSLVLLHIAKLNNIERDHHVEYLDVVII